MPATCTKALASNGPESQYTGSRMSRPATTPAIAHVVSTAMSVSPIAPPTVPIARVRPSLTASGAAPDPSVAGAGLTVAVRCLSHHAAGHQHRD